MASSFYSNTVHIDFASVLTMEIPGIVSVLHALRASGLEGFLCCPAVVYESELVEFFKNGLVRDDLVVSTVNGVPIEISEQLLAETFELPVDGLSELSEMPKDKIYDARSIVLMSGEPVSFSGRKGQMKIEYRLLCDIMAKSISVKAGSFNALTVDKFALLTAVVCGVKMNWASVLFNIFNKMVTPGSKQAKGFAIQISLLLEDIPNLNLGESSEFTVSKILTAKTVHRYISVTDKESTQEAADASPVKQAPKRPGASKKRPAAVPMEAPVVKRKRSLKKKSGSSQSALKMVVVAQEAIPIQIIPATPAVETMVEDQQAKIVEEHPADEVAATTGEQEPVGEQVEEQPAVESSLEKPAAEGAAEEIADDISEKADEPVVAPVMANVVNNEVSNADDVDTIIQQELKQQSMLHGLRWDRPCCSVLFEGRLGSHRAIPAYTIFEVSSQRQYDDTLPSVSKFFRMIKKRWADVCLEVVDLCASRRLLPVGSLQFCESVSVIEPVYRVAPCQSPIFAFRVSQFCSVFIDFSLFSWLPTADIIYFLSSIVLNRTAFRSENIYQNIVSVAPSIQFSLDQRESSPASVDSSSSLHFDTTDVDATVSSLPPVSIDLSAALADFQAILSEQINESQSGISSRLHMIEQDLRDSLREQEEVFKNLFQGARQEGRTIDDVQTLRFNEFRKNILAQNDSIFIGLADVRKEVQEVNAKVDIIASRLNDVQQHVEATKEALSHQLLEFQSQAQANQNILHAQLSELVNYINRGSADKKGESSSRGPQQPSNVQIRDSAVRTPSFARRVEIAQRRIVETVLDADRNAESLERQAAGERDRERRRREARLLKRRRNF
ncbi:dystroglycan-like [Dorcoceras hygrometricum]|uniref:Dystroglycan-like n=1 Tax=Dorcoceras hygrometricum TaxID=472368 RepID=A0A2Z7CTV3_9LAMI|nr:dystroglycan-like [Dorcoceras hygrometricum]